MMMESNMLPRRDKIGLAAHREFAR